MIGTSLQQHESVYQAQGILADPHHPLFVRFYIRKEVFHPKEGQIKQKPRFVNVENICMAREEAALKNNFTKGTKNGTLRHTTIEGHMRRFRQDSCVSL